MSEPVIIKPTIGRRLWFWPSKNTGEAGFAYSDEAQPCDAGIAYVWSDTLINISVVDQNGVIHSRTSVPLIQAGEKPPEQGFYCEWMPYQQGQAKKQSNEGVESRLLAEQASLVYMISDAASRASSLATAEGDVLARVLLEEAVRLLGASEPPAATQPLIDARNHADGTVAAAAPLPAASTLTDSAIKAEIPAKGLTARRVTPTDLEGVIEHTNIVKFKAPSGQILRWAVLTCLNGYAVTGRPSVAVSPENDNAELGESIAISNAKDELWPLLGYELKTQLAAAHRA